MFAYAIPYSYSDLINDLENAKRVLMENKNFGEPQYNLKPDKDDYIGETFESPMPREKMESPTKTDEKGEI